MTGPGTPGFMKKQDLYEMRYIYISYIFIHTYIYIFIHVYIIFISYQYMYIIFQKHGYSIFLRHTGYISTLDLAQVW